MHELSSLIPGSVNIVSGFTSGKGAGNNDMYVVKLNSNCDTIWTRTYGGTGEESGNTVIQTADGGYMAAGYTTSWGKGGKDVYYVRTDAGGDTIWTRNYGPGPHDDHINDAVQLSDGNFVFTGVVGSFVEMTSTDTVYIGWGEEDVLIVKLDFNGFGMWAGTFGYIQSEEGFAVRPTADGGFVLAGTTDSFGEGLTNVYFIKSDTTHATPYTVGLPETEAGDKISFYPNPFNEHAFLTLNKIYDDINLSFFDISGRSVNFDWKRIAGDRIIISSEDISAGIYFYTIQSKNSIIGQGKMVVTD